MHFTQLKYETFLNTNNTDLWSFLSNPDMLEKLTPEKMEFSLVNASFSKNEFYEGLLILHSVTPFLGYKTLWLSEIKKIDPNHYFIDQQIDGPFKFWQHEHRIVESDEGQKMVDIISYQLPYGFLNKLIDWLIVKPQIKKLFDFRNNQIKSFFEK